MNDHKFPSLFSPYRRDPRVAQTVAEVVGLLVLASVTVGLLFLFCGGAA